MSKAILINGDTRQLEDWSQINWQKAHKVVKNLRCRIFRARKLSQGQQLRRLQKLLIRSLSNLLLSVRQITQVNNGKQTAGIDKEVINTPAQRVKLVNEWEMPKAGFIDSGIYNPSETGTPQGGVISPLLANIGLHGLEELIKSVKLPKTKWGRRPQLGFIRYADDFVVTAKEKQNLEDVLILIKQWLEERGLEISTEKTRIVHIDEGFDFLGFNIRQYKGKLLIKPQKEKVLAFCKKIKSTISNMKANTQEEVIAKLNPLLRGFANYYRGVISKETFSYIHHRVVMSLYFWAKRRHPKKSKTWVKNKYFHYFKGDNWTFMCKTSDRRGKEKQLILNDISKIAIERHIKVKGDASPDDSSLREYWNNRKLKQGKNYWAKGSKYYQVAINQNWKCPVCGENLFNGEEIETHHIVPVINGGDDSTDNLVHLHKACHKQVHSKSKLKA
ncbi:MAG: reverse transcriptase N-terminal domain-containing protein [Cyanobacterium sp. T60_A2020_053]|nr:reverse transcriptase N-terminal domain-containing protein [Cyanobacterium sp. T60_A2020_053]